MDPRGWCTGPWAATPQAQINAQLLTSVIDDGFDASAAVSAPRWTLGPIEPDDPANTVNLEPGLDEEIDPLTSRGWAARLVEHRDAFGHSHMIEINDGQLRGAADLRAESLAAAW
jgi:gamma-glutamyltranspeptidase